MQLPAWTRAKRKVRRRAISSAERRRREDLLIPLVVGQLEPAPRAERVHIQCRPGAHRQRRQPDAHSAECLQHREYGHESVVAGQPRPPTPESSASPSRGSTPAAPTAFGSIRPTARIGPTSAASATPRRSCSMAPIICGSSPAVRTPPVLRSRSAAWDESDGSTIGSYVSTTSNGGTTAFSNTTANSSITIYPTLSVSGTGASASLDDQISQPFNTATIGDSDSTDPGEMVTITITQINVGTNTVDSTFDDGSLSSPNVAFSS